METFDANELVTIETFQNDIEAEIVKGRLMNAGIKSFIFKDDCGGTRPHMQLTLGVDLKVRQIDFARASEVLESIGTLDIKSGGLKPGENKAAIFSILTWVLCFVGGGLVITSMKLGKLQFFIGLIILIAGILFGVSSSTIKKKIENKKIT